MFHCIGGTYLPPIIDDVKVEGALELSTPGSRMYALGLVSGEASGEELFDSDRSLGLGRSCGEAPPFCLVRFICKHLSG